MREHTPVREGHGAAPASDDRGGSSFVDDTGFEEARREAMLREVRAGLTARPRTLPPKYFYDARGSALFEEITRLPEYYLTRTERALLETHAGRWMTELRPRVLLELGAGSAEKTRLLIEAMLTVCGEATYVPVDISHGFLERTAEALTREYPVLVVRPIAADIAADFDVPEDLARPLMVALLGSSIGNFEGAEAEALLRRATRGFGANDRLLLGADLRKDLSVLLPAYDDAAGVTAEFNRNVLRVLDRELGADFDPAAFDHRVRYDEHHHWIEMHLVARRDAMVRIPGMEPVAIAKGESIRTETSAKYDRGAIEAMFAGAGLRLTEWTTDDRGMFALALGARAK